MTKQELTILVKDFGKGFEPTSIEDPDINKKMGTQDKRGWGLKLMKTLSDDFRIKSDEQGTRITIKKILR
jgi:anti-sigma regulatory factor (Ser/Thr protein kinase)